jgi:hypothetical protein
MQAENSFQSNSTDTSVPMPTENLMRTSPLLWTRVSESLLVRSTTLPTEHNLSAQKELTTSENAFPRCRCFAHCMETETLVLTGSGWRGVFENVLSTYPRRTDVWAPTLTRRSSTAGRNPRATSCGIPCWNSTVWGLRLGAVQLVAQVAGAQPLQDCGKGQDAAGDSRPPHRHRHAAFSAHVSVSLDPESHAVVCLCRVEAAVHAAKVLQAL